MMKCRKLYFLPAWSDSDWTLARQMSSWRVQKRCSEIAQRHVGRTKSCRQRLSERQRPAQKRKVKGRDLDPASLIIKQRILQMRRAIERKTEAKEMIDDMIALLR